MFKLADLFAPTVPNAPPGSLSGMVNQTMAGGPVAAPQPTDQWDIPPPAGAPVAPAMPGAAIPDPYDLTHQFNTPLVPVQEAQYQGWLAGHSAQLGRDISLDNATHDTRGAFLAGEQPPVQGMTWPEQYRKIAPPAQAPAPGGADGWDVPPAPGQLPAPVIQPAPVPLGGKPRMDVADAIHGQESGGRATSQTSIDGAAGGWQVMPGTFAQYARPGENIGDPKDNERVARRYIDYLKFRANGDPARVAVGYFSGPGNIAPPGSPTPWITDKHDGNGVTVSTYVSSVLSRMHGGIRVSGPGGVLGGANPEGGSDFAPGVNDPTQMPNLLQDQPAPGGTLPPDPWAVLDLTKGPGTTGADPWAVQPEVSTPTHVPLGERFASNVGAGHAGTLLGAADQGLALGLAPNTQPIDPNTGKPIGGASPREQVRQSISEDQYQRENMLPWYQEQGLGNKITAGGAALAGSLVGGMSSPESLVGGGAYKLGEKVVPQIAEHAAVQAGVQGAANVGAQGINVADGTQKAFDPWEAAQSAGMGAAFGAAPTAVRAGREHLGLGPQPIVIKARDGSSRVVEDRPETLFDRPGATDTSLTPTPPDAGPGIAGADAELPGAPQVTTHEPGGVPGPVPASPPSPVPEAAVPASPRPEDAASSTPAPAPPTPAEPSRPGAILAELDARNAPDEEYKSAFSTGSKEPLKAGETWRGRLENWVNQEKAPAPVEAAPASETELASQSTASPMDAFLGANKSTRDPPVVDGRGGGATAILAPDGSWVTADGHAGHEAMLRKSGFDGSASDFVRETGAIRVAGPGNYEIHQTPTPAQERAMARQVRETGVGGYTVDAHGPDGRVQYGSFPPTGRGAADMREWATGIFGKRADTLNADRPPLGGVRPEGGFNKGTSPYREVFTDAGHDPDLAVSKPIRDQVKIVTDQVKSKFGFKDVTVDPRQDPKEVRDQMSNFYSNAKSMAHVLGMPYEGIGLNGRVSFTTKPYVNPKQALGSYAPGSRTINIPGRSNSFAHEWTHAADHYLADELAKNPSAMRLLSMTKGLGDDKVGGRNIKPGTPAEAFANVMRAIFGGDAPTAAEALKLQYVARGSDPAAASAAAKRLAVIETKYSAGTRTIKNSTYWNNPAEMLARAHEAYVSDQIEKQGGDTRAVAKADYTAEPKDPKDAFNTYYPQQNERDHIFQKFTELHDALRRESIMGTGPAGDMANTGGMMSPRNFGKLATPSVNPGLFARLKGEAQALTNVRAKMAARSGMDPNKADPGRLTFGTRTADQGRYIAFSRRAVGGAITARQPAGPARENFQRIMDLLTPAEGLRSAKEARGRYIGETWEGEVRHNSRPNTNLMSKIMEEHGLGWTDESLTATKQMLLASRKGGTAALAAAGQRDVPTEKLMLRHVLTEGDATTFTPPGGTTAVPIPDNIIKAGGKLRYLLDQEWERNRAAGINVGFAKSGYFPRIFDDHRVFTDRAGFEAAATKLHTLMFERDVGKDPEKLAGYHEGMPKEVRDGLDPAVQKGMGELTANLKKQDALQAAINAGSHPDPAQAAAELATLKGAADKLHAQLHDPIRDAYAAATAENWRSRINTGDPTDFDTRGPNASYTKGRELPAEADTIMRDFLVTDPNDALPRYFQQSARKIAYIERFGAKPEGKDTGSLLDAMLKKAGDAKPEGAQGQDIEAMRRLVESVTGFQRSGLPPPIEHLTNQIHAYGTTALMTRAAFSSLTEPMAFYARTGSLKGTFEAFANQLGDIVGTAGSRDRAALADALGITMNHLHDSILSDRTEAQYRDEPGLSKLLANYYKRTGLTQLTNAQRRSVMGGGHTVLDAWSKDILAAETAGAKVNAKTKRLDVDARAEFRDLGIPDAEHVNLAKWITAQDGLPSLNDLDTPGGKLWGRAVSRLVDKVIQDPTRMDKPMLSSNPVGRLAFGLMSFNYSFYHNIVEHAFEKAGARIGEAYEGARAAGAGKLGATAAALPAVGRNAAHLSAAGAAIFAGAFLQRALRERIFNGTAFDQHQKDGDLTEWLSDLAIQTTGVNGPLDPVIQAITGLKYRRDLSSLAEGPFVGFIAQNMGDLLSPLAGAGSPDTNTARYNATKAAYNMAIGPALTWVLTALPGGPFTAAGYGAGMMALSSRGAADKAATKLAGPKGMKNDGTLPRDASTMSRVEKLQAAKEAPTPKDAGRNGGLMGNVPIGLADDFIAPGMRVAGPLWNATPKVGKIAAATAAGGYAAKTLADVFRHPTPHAAPPPK